jgi:hypothetical protein
LWTGPEGAPLMSQCRVALLGKGMAIPCAVRLALTH